MVVWSFFLWFILILVVISILVSTGMVPAATTVQAGISQEFLAPTNRNAAVKWALKNNHNDGRFWGDTAYGKYCTTCVTQAIRPAGSMYRPTPGTCSWRTG